MVTPKGASEVAYSSGNLKLKAWMSRPSGVGKHQAVLYLHPGFALTIDLERQTVATPDGAMQWRFELEEFRKHCLLNGLDEIALTLGHADAIRDFESRRLHEQPWLA